MAERASPCSVNVSCMRCRDELKDLAHFQACLTRVWEHFAKGTPAGMHR